MAALRPVRVAALKAKQVVGSGREFMARCSGSNVNSADAFIQCFNKANTTAVTLGTTAPDWVVSVPPAAGGNRGKFAEDFFDAVPFPAGLIVAATTTPTGSTLVTTGLDVNFGLK